MPDADIQKRIEALEAALDEIRRLIWAPNTSLVRVRIALILKKLKGE